MRKQWLSGKRSTRHKCAEQGLAEASKVLHSDPTTMLHDKEHGLERQYADNLWYRGLTYPTQVTAVNIDAPTQHQFDLPFQRRASRDTVKSLDGARKWQSKLTGAM
eukprot:4529767-Pleurochrysis_carterae.AAC.1